VERGDGGDSVSVANEGLARPAVFSGPPGQFPASMVGTIGDVAAVSSCLSLLPRGWGVATIDFTVKMTGIAKGERLRAKGHVLQNGRSISVGAADVFVVIGNEESLWGNTCQHQEFRDQGWFLIKLRIGLHPHRL
jgi:hypothetical protein